MRTILYEDYQVLVDLLYAYHLSGGPLHIIVDDDNVADHHLDFCEQQVHLGGDPKWLRHVMLAIIEYLRQIPDEESRERFIDGTSVEVDS